MSLSTILCEIPFRPPRAGPPVWIAGANLSDRNEYACIVALGKGRPSAKGRTRRSCSNLRKGRDTDLRQRCVAAAKLYRIDLFDRRISRLGNSLNGGCGHHPFPDAPPEKRAHRDDAERAGLQDQAHGRLGRDQAAHGGHTRLMARKPSPKPVKLP